MLNENEIAKELGAKLKALRKEKGLTQQEVGQLMRTTKSTINKIETGLYTFGVDKLHAYLDALGYEIEFRKR